MLSWSYKVGFLGTILLWEICLNRTGAGVNATPVLNRQGGNVLVAAFSAVAFLLPKWIYILRRSLWSRVRALPSLSGTRILPAPEADLAKAMAASRPWIWGKPASSEFIFQRQHSSYSPPAADNLIPSTHPFTVKLRSDSFQKLLMTKIEEPLKKMHRIF